MNNRPMKLGGNRYGQALSSKDDGGGAKRMDVINWNKTGKELKFFQPKVDTLIKFNIIPFEVKSIHHPLVAQGEMKIGELDFMLDIHVHRYIGPSKADVICPKKNYGKPCPICDVVNQLYDQDKEEEAKQIRATRRCYFNVQPVGKMGPEALQIFSVSHYLFTKELIEEANACADGKGVIPFADLEDGSLISCRVAEEAFGKSKTTKYKSFRFVRREEEVGPELVDRAISFDEFLVVKTPAELEAILYGQPDDGDDEDNEQNPAPQRAQAQEKAQGKAEGQEEVGNVFEEEDRQEEARNTKTRPQKEATKAGGSCSYGGTFGKDVDSLRQCRRCEVWEDCNKASGG